MATTAPTIAEFRAAFPAFASDVRYPDPQIDFWLTLAVIMLIKPRWGAAYSQGIMLFTAHNVALDGINNAAGQTGGTPGVVAGILNSKSVDKVSAGYDTGSVAIADGAHWNLTNYGQRYLYMARMFGTGPIQIGIPSGCVPPYSSAGAWSGPWPWNFPSQNGPN